MLRFFRLLIRIKSIFWPTLAFLVICYFGYHLTQGERGLITWWKMMNEVREAKIALSHSDGDKKNWEYRVSLLKGNNLDPDLLDERIRKMLNYVKKDEIYIPIENLQLPKSQ